MYIQSITSQSKKKKLKKIKYLPYQLVKYFFTVGWSLLFKELFIEVSIGLLSFIITQWLRIMRDYSCTPRESIAGMKRFCFSLPGHFFYGIISSGNLGTFTLIVLILLSLFQPGRSTLITRQSCDSRVPLYVGLPLSCEDVRAACTGFIDHHMNIVDNSPIMEQK